MILTDYPTSRFEVWYIMFVKLLIEEAVFTENTSQCCPTSRAENIQKKNICHISVETHGSASLRLPYN